jgi:YHS domain-containing protein
LAYITQNEAIMVRAHSPHNQFLNRLVFRMSFVCVTWVVASCVGALAAAGGDDEKREDGGERRNVAARRSAKQALQTFNDWVGQWRGVGQPKRGSNKGAWTEEAEWSWSIDRDTAYLKFQVKNGKQIDSGILEFDPGSKKYRFVARLPAGEAREYTAERANADRVVLTTAGSDSSAQYRLTFQLRHQDRLLLLIEAKPSGQTAFSRVAEVGYTRKGGSFAGAADAGPKCIVTGGRGTMTVEYKGKSYYVCCTGCRTAFLEDPEGIIAEAAEQGKKERKK